MSIEPIDIRDLTGHPGLSRTVHVRGTLDGLGTEVATLKTDEPVEGDLLLESVIEGILATGRLRSTFALRCARCLKDFELAAQVDVHELFSSNPESDDEDVYPLDPQGWLAPEQMVRDAPGLSGSVQRMRRRPQPGGMPRRSPGGRPALGRPRIRAPRPRRPSLNRSQKIEKETDGRPKEETEQSPQCQTRSELEGRGPAVRGVPAVSPAEAPASGVQQLWVLRRPAGR